jgi:hypothetical protein
MSIKEIYSISLCFGKKTHLDIKSPILLPYLEKSKQHDLKFPFFYKIYSIIYPNLPVPSDVEVRAIFYDKKGTCCTGILDSIKIKFEDYFLPISVPPQYSELYSTKEGKTELRKTLFKKLWKMFKTNSSNYIQYVNSYRLIEFDKQTMILAVFSRLGAFLINEDFLSQDILINIPCTGDVKDDISNRENVKVKTFYDLQKRKFNKSSYDFIFDEFLEKNAEDSHFANYGELKHGKYHLAEVLIFVPEK